MLNWYLANLIIKIDPKGITMAHILTTTMTKVINDSPVDAVFLQEQNQRINDITYHVYQKAFNKLKSHWDPILAERHFPDGIPTDPDKYAELVFSQHNYSNK